MARPAIARSPEETDGIAAAHVNEEALAAAGEDSRILANRVAQIDSRFGVDIPYDLNLYIAAIRSYAAEAAARLLQIGRMLIQMHERETHADYAAALERIGISDRFARRARQAAIRLGDRPKLVALGSSKALELLSEDDDELDALEHGGTITGVTLDDVDRMSIPELRRALRRERKARADEKTATDALVKDKDERINKLLRRSAIDDGEEVVQHRANELLEEMDRKVVELNSTVQDLLRLDAAIEQLYQDAHLDTDHEVQGRRNANGDWAVARLADLTRVFGD